MRELRELERGWGALGRGWVDEGEVGESFGCVESMAEMMLIGTVSWRVYGRRLSDDFTHECGQCGYQYQFPFTLRSAPRPLLTQRIPGPLDMNFIRAAFETRPVIIRCVDGL